MLAVAAVGLASVGKPGVAHTRPSPSRYPDHQATSEGDPVLQPDPGRRSEPVRGRQRPVEPQTEGLTAEDPRAADVLKDRWGENERELGAGVVQPVA